ncbi:MAG: hypothetical protein B7Z22_09800 [Hyphomonas sp. 32-62-5]|nr:MAG: hypothetical protein B7Z22_09800 [Hyphomonas sp. 32-62-5]
MGGFREGAWGPAAQEASAAQTNAIPIHFERANPAVIMDFTLQLAFSPQLPFLTRLSGFITRSAFPIPKSSRPDP